MKSCVNDAAQCFIRFGQKSHMQKHVITVHMKEKPYKCDQCSYQTATRSTLNRHVSVIHKGAKAFQCQVRIAEDIFYKSTMKLPN